MKSFKTLGIVIKRRNSGEADRIISFFSREKGKLRLIAKGIRHIKSRRAPHLEIFSYSKLVVDDRHHYYYIKEADIINTFANIRNSFQKINICFHICEIIDKIIPENSKEEEIFDNFLKVLVGLNEEKDIKKIRSEISYFVKFLLFKMGYLDREKDVSYSQMLAEIEKISEKPLNSLRILTKLKGNIHEKTQKSKLKNQI